MKLEKVVTRKKFSKELWLDLLSKQLQKKNFVLALIWGKYVAMQYRSHMQHITPYSTHLHSLMPCPACSMSIT